MRLIIPLRVRPRLKHLHAGPGTLGDRCTGRLQQSAVSTHGGWVDGAGAGGAQGRGAGATYLNLHALLYINVQPAGQLAPPTISAGLLIGAVAPW